MPRRPHCRRSPRPTASSSSTARPWSPDHQAARRTGRRSPGPCRRQTPVRRRRRPARRARTGTGPGHRRSCARPPRPVVDVAQSDPWLRIGLRVALPGRADDDAEARRCSSRAKVEGMADACAVATGISVTASSRAATATIAQDVSGAVHGTPATAKVGPGPLRRSTYCERYQLLNLDQVDGRDNLQSNCCSKDAAAVLARFECGTAPDLFRDGAVDHVSRGRILRSSTPGVVPIDAWRDGECADFHNES